MSKERTWPYSLLTPDELGRVTFANTTDCWNVRKPTGQRVFREHLTKSQAVEAKDALNEAWDHCE